MKKSYLILSLIVATLGFGCNFGVDSENQSISIKNNDVGYNFEASYPKKKTEKVVAYIEETLKDDALFTAPSDVKNMDIVLPDSTKFYLKAEPGFIVIDFKKQKNSLTSYQKMEELCKGIKELLSN